MTPTLCCPSRPPLPLTNVDQSTEIPSPPPHPTPRTWLSAPPPPTPCLSTHHHPVCLHTTTTYRKVAKAYFSLLEVLCHNHTGTVACQDSQTFAFVLNSLDQVGSCLHYLHTTCNVFFWGDTMAPDP